MKNRNLVMYHSLLAAALPLLIFTTSLKAEATCRGPVEKWTLVNEKREFTGECKLNQPLKFSSKRHTYPAMAGVTLNVNYWQGAYERTQSIQSLYLRETFSCDGQLQSSLQIPQQSNEPVEFAVENPNLQPSVDQSYLAHAPLTDQEAAASLTGARQRCLSTSF